MSDQEVDKGKRCFLLAATSVVGGAAAGVAAVPFVGSMFPSERAKAAGAPVEVDISTLAPGDKVTAEWRGQPVWVVRRTKEMLETLPKLDSAVSDPKSERKQDELTPKYVRNEHRSIKPEYLVVVGICTHLGCSPVDKLKAGPEPFESTGRADSTARVMARCSISPAVSTRTSLRPTISRSRRTSI
jgi:ubiquinol-cytochrome c reductase iron-sulfur subunit